MNQDFFTNKTQGGVIVVKYDIQYEGLVDELVKDDSTRYYFKVIKNAANKYRIELSEEDFKDIFKIEKSKSSGEWLIHQMSINGGSLKEALMTYIGWT